MQVPPSSIDQSVQNSILNQDPENSETSPLFRQATQSTPSHCLNKRVAKIAASLISMGIGVVCVGKGISMVITANGENEFAHRKTGILLTVIGLTSIVTPFIVLCSKEKKDITD